LWRTTHYFHGEEGAEDLWGKGFTKGGDSRTREYWTGLFAHGFGLCGTTHSQWTAEMQSVLGHARGRGVGVAGHNSFEVYLTGASYGAGKWVMLDHDVCTVPFDEQGSRLLSLAEVKQDWKQLLDWRHKPERQHGWPICGLHAEDRSAFSEYNTAEYLAGYAGPPPMVHLRRGETLRRYFEPGLDDGKTFVFWGRDYEAAGIPGPERSLTWVNQPEKLFGATKPVSFKQGQARFANAVYVYQPDFATDDYREGVIEESDAHVTFEFRTPYIIGATPAGKGAWSIYEPGGRNGLVLRGLPCAVSISTDRGQTWKRYEPTPDSLDLTDDAKGRRQYFLKLHTAAKALRGSGFTITTVCQANSATMPRLRDGGTTVRFAASGNAVLSAGPNLPQAQAHVVAGGFGTPTVTLSVAPPRGERMRAVHAAAHVVSGNPPDAKVQYRIEASLDGGKSWRPFVQNWNIPKQGDQPPDYWSQSMCWGSLDLENAAAGPVQIRFANDGRRSYSRAEAHLVYEVPRPMPPGSRIPGATIRARTKRRRFLPLRARRPCGRFQRGKTSAPVGCRSSR
jgi:hypothetical protein